MASRRRQHLDGYRVSTREHRREVAHHATRPFGQSQLDRPVQILDDTTVPAGNLKDHYLGYGVCSGSRPRSGDRAAGGRWHEVHIEYAEGRITGTKATADGVTPIDVAIDGPIWDGNLWGLTFGALPLHEGGQYRLPFWQYDKGFGTFLVNVTGSEMVDTPDGPTEAWVADAGTNPDRLSRYQIGKSNGAELGYRSGGGGEQRFGGDCTGMG